MGWVEDQRAKEEEQQREAMLRYSNNANYDPALSARIFGVSAATNIPQDVVAQDIDRLEEDLRTHSFNYDNYTDKVNGSPIFNDFAAENPYNFAVLDRDREGMWQIERSARDIGLGAYSGYAMTQLADLSNENIRNGGSTPEQEARMADLRKVLDGGDFGAEGHVMKLLVGSARQSVVLGKMGYEGIDEALMMGLAGAAWGFGTGTVGGPAGQTIGAGVGAIQGSAAGMLTGGIQYSFELERGLAFDQFILQGFDRKDALMFSNAVGGVNAVAELTGIGALLKRVPGFKRVLNDKAGDAIAEIFTKPTMKHAVARASAQYGEQVVTEVITEVFQDTTVWLAEEHMKDVARNVSGDTRPSMAMGEIPMFEMWKETAIHTLYGTLLLQSAGPIMNYKADKNRASAALQRQESWARLKEGVDSSTTKVEARSVWDEFIGRLAKDGPIKSVRYTREAWKEYWQSQKIDPDQAAKDLGIDIENINVLDPDIVIPFGTFLDKIVPTDHFLGLQNDLKIGNDMTLRESQQWFNDQDAIIKAVRLEVDKVGDHSVLRDMEHDVTGMLMSAGRMTKDAAGPQAEMFVTQIYNLAMQEGKDPKKLLAEKLHSIRRQVPESFSGGSFELGVDELLNSIREGHYPKQREIYGNNLIDMMRGVGGIQDDGGEMSNRDLGKLYPGLISKAGKTVDGMAEAAFEAGFIKEFDSNMFLEALDQQLGGNSVYSAQHAPDVALEEMLARMEQTAQFFEEENIDITNMSNAEVRQAMDGIQTLNQSTSQTLDEWTELLVALTEAGEQSQGHLDEVDTLLSKAERTRPRVSGSQDFKDVELTDRVSDNETATYSAQDRYNNAVKSRNVLKQLAKCVNG